MQRENPEDRTGITPSESPKGAWRLGPLALGPLDLGRFMRRITKVLDFRDEEKLVQETRRDFGTLARYCREAYEKRGKVSGLLAIAKVADAYGRLDEVGKDAFFQMLKNEFAVEPMELEAAMAAYREAAVTEAATKEAATKENKAFVSGESGGMGGAKRDAGGNGRGAEAGSGEAENIKAAALVRLSHALESPRHTLFKQFNTIPSGIKFLVDLRADLYARLKRDPGMVPMEYELRRLLEAFFNLGFLQLRRIGWDSPAVLLENLIRYEAVNSISNWDDLKNRLISDRACYAFIHPAMPDEPVIFVEVALTQGMADSIQRLLDPAAPDLPQEEADTAIFYGISNAQAGLRGIPFGNLLIKQVATRLKSEVPNLRTFATLSPLPRFSKDFLDPAVADGSIARFYEEKEARALCDALKTPTVPEAVRAALDSPDWFLRPRVSGALRPGLMRAVRYYLTEVRKGGHAAACPVAHFHGSNGALLARINWLGDTSDHGLSQSAGLMVNYRYDMEEFEAHQDAYLQTGKLTLGKAVREL